MDRKPTDGRPVDDNENDCNSNDSTSSTDDKTYHFRKGSDLDGFESFGALYADGLFTDLAICCSGRVFRCHRVVMAASSAYIKNALSAFNGSENTNCNTIMILPQEIKVADMEAILQFIYNGQVEVTRDAIESFLSSAKILHIKGLANIKLVYNNNHKNQNNNHNHNHKNKTPNNTPNTKSFNNENQNSQNLNHNNNCNNNNNENNSNINANNSPNKRKNGIIGGHSTPHRSPNLKTDLNLTDKLAENAQNQSFHSSPPLERAPEPTESTPPKPTPPITTSSSARRKQKTPKALTTNGLMINNTVNTVTAINGEIDDMEEEEVSQRENTEEIENGENDLKIDVSVIKAEEALALIKNPVKANGTPGETVVGVPSMPCMIQIDADPTTFPSFCAENLQKSAKRRRSSSLRMDGKHPKALTKGNGDAIGAKTPLIRTSGRKLGFIQFHKKSSTTIWNSNNKWKCEICNKLYGNKQTLKEHMDYFHSNRAEQIFTCTICSKEYTWKKSLMKHYRDIHQMNNTSLNQLNKSTDSQSKPCTDNETSTEAPTQQWVTQSEDNSSQSK